jgi:hypothetical protein
MARHAVGPSPPGCGSISRAAGCQTSRGDGRRSRRQPCTTSRPTARARIQGAFSGPGVGCCRPMISRATPRASARGLRTQPAWCMRGGALRRSSRTHRAGNPRAWHTRLCASSARSTASRRRSATTIPTSGADSGKPERFRCSKTCGAGWIITRRRYCRSRLSGRPSATR